ncbi:hypothetical protein AVEN_184623-1 [Araneus ventricosus]|uniref:Uncharacterized protein n=1 Tax=Araneus ventricosus TaxID=182803 RepID=A0A4Y2E7R7_ARAVE|nr:hypothetical protein AVEN_184623-1 [Araneus ventricosus]
MEKKQTDPQETEPQSVWCAQKQQLPGIINYTLGWKFLAANAWQALEQSQTSTFGSSRYLVPTGTAHSLLLTMRRTTSWTSAKSDFYLRVLKALGTNGSCSFSPLDHEANDLMDLT